ncbi:MAG: hypothetical protein RIQ79_1944 [Verrucomicrobiota bacterium]
MPRVGVLINNYNNGPWLRACVDSVLAQTRPADEVIVYDDGSSDDSLAILQSYGDRITLLAGAHDFTRSGIASQTHAVAGAFAASTADHLYLLDGDDVFFPDKISHYEAAWARMPEAALLHSPCQNLTSDGRPLDVCHWPHKHALDYWQQTYRLHDCNLYYPTSTLAFTRSYLRRVLPMNINDGLLLHIDVRLCSIAPLYAPVYLVPEAQSYWRARPDSMWRAHRRGPLAEMWSRNRYYNRKALALGARPLLLWHNHLFFTECARAFVSPRLRDMFHRLRRKLLQS